MPDALPYATPQFTTGMRMTNAGKHLKAVKTYIIQLNNMTVFNTQCLTHCLYRMGPVANPRRLRA